MSSFFVAGPCEIHVGVGSGQAGTGPSGIAYDGGALAFLGYSKSGVRGSARPFYEDVKSDVQGPLSAHTVQGFGEEFWTSLDLEIWNESVWNLIASRANVAGSANAAPGFFPSGAIGALLPEEGLTYRLLVYRPYAVSKAMFVAAGMIPAYNFARAWLAGPDDIDPQGTRNQIVRCVFRAIMKRDPATNNSLLYDFNYSGKPAVN